MICALNTKEPQPGGRSFERPCMAVLLRRHPIREVDDLLKDSTSHPQLVHGANICRCREEEESQGYIDDHQIVIIIIIHHHHTCTHIIAEVAKLLTKVTP